MPNIDTVLPRALLLLPLPLVTACAGNWKEYNYGPGDWLAETTSLRVESLQTYEHFLSPEIVQYQGSTPCPDGALGCAFGDANRCEIYIDADISAPDRQLVLAEEMRHCRGWCHEDETKQWYPCPPGADVRDRATVADSSAAMSPE